MNGPYRIGDQVRTKNDDGETVLAVVIGEPFGSVPWGCDLVPVAYSASPGEVDYGVVPVCDVELHYATEPTRETAELALQSLCRTYGLSGVVAMLLSLSLYECGPRWSQCSASLLVTLEKLHKLGV